MTTETRQRLLDALVSCRAIVRYTAALELDSYKRDDIVRDAVERRLTIIGEALNRAEFLESTLSDKLPEIRQIVGLRNRGIHGYDAVDDAIIWDVVKNKLPQLEARLADLLGERDLP